MKVRDYLSKIKSWYLRLSPAVKPGVFSVALLFVLIMVVFLIMAITGCDKVKSFASDVESEGKKIVDAGATVVSKVEEIQNDASSLQSAVESAVSSVSEAAEDILPSDNTWPSYGVGQFDLDEAWNTEGDIVILNDNQPYFSDSDKVRTDAFEEYSDLDSLSRCGVAYANICTELMPTEKREEIGSVKPSGWHSVKYPEQISDKYLYNRCHLIGFQLAGENANPKNLITGTRYLNVTLMLPYENAIDDFIEANPDMHVLYRVTPVFDGDDLVCKGIIMEGWSVEDNGDGVCFCIFEKNIQPGITIDYATGESHIS